ncbi:integrase [Natronocella acetinitrilica]|uniref:Integrase n=1 Tax=Natronocella acetinitrilica TaxID=414046 RepID=A0AAE3G513_9GAMM|nr:tyrosine-type recombinase/integrase [Natronocella acetinitrilica]MCP1675497.1 integrase [Natronocella acetinitrilica]
MYQKHGAYYLVRQNRWVRLAGDLPSALQEYARLTATPQGNMSGLIDTAIAQASERGVSSNTLRQYQMGGDRLKEALVEFTVSDVKPHHIGQLMDHFRKTPNLANRMRSLLKMAFDHAVVTGMRESNPVLSIPRHREKKRDRYLTDEEWDAIYLTASPALRCIMDVAYYTGQRIGDILSIRLSQISEEGIAFQQEKTGKRLTVAMNSGLRDAIARAKGLHGTTRLYLLGQRNGKIRSYRGARDLLHRAAERAGVADVGWHDIRAKSITDTKRQGKNAQALAGHTTEAQTNRYLRGRETTLVEGPSFRQSNSGGAKSTPSH